MSGTIKIAVTGASGFIGTYLVPALLQHGMEVRLLIRKSVAKQSYSSMTYCLGDLLQPDSLRSLVNGTDVVVHLAGYAHASGRQGSSMIDLYRKINFEGTQNLFHCAVEAGVRRFVFVSSVKAGGEHSHECLDESSSIPPQDLYGQIKRETEDWLFKEGTRQGVEICVLRPALVYGPSVKGNLAAMLRGIDRGWFPPVPETRNIRSMISVQDAASAIMAAATRPEAAGQVCILTDGEEYSTRRMYSAMAAAFGKSVRIWVTPIILLRGLGLLGDMIEVLTRHHFPVSSRLITRLIDSACYRSIRADSVLNYQPRYRLEDLLPEMIAAYRGSSVVK